MIRVNGNPVPYTENQTVEQLVEFLRNDLRLHDVFVKGECIVMRNGKVIPPHQRREVLVEREDEFSIFPIVDGG
jgi:thiamine biosynthesis protein ThiS